MLRGSRARRVTGIGRGGGCRAGLLGSGLACTLLDGTGLLRLESSLLSLDLGHFLGVLQRLLLDLLLLCWILGNDRDKVRWHRG